MGLLGHSADHFCACMTRLPLANLWSGAYTYFTLQYVCICKNMETQLRNWEFIGITRSLVINHSDSNVNLYYNDQTNKSLTESPFYLQVNLYFKKYALMKMDFFFSSLKFFLNFNLYTLLPQFMNGCFKSYEINYFKTLSTNFHTKQLLALKPYLLINHGR